MKWMTLSLFLAVGTLLAQDPAPRAVRQAGARGAEAPQRAAVRNAEALKQVLGLTDVQVQQLRELRKQQFEAAKPAREQLRENRKALAEAMQAQNPDPARVGQLMVDAKKLRESMRGAPGEYQNKAQALLTAEQKSKLLELQDAGKRAAAARQAMALGLLAPPEGAAGRMRGAMGPRGVR